MRYRATTANQVLFENIVLHYLADYYNRKLFFLAQNAEKNCCPVLHGELTALQQTP